MPQSNEVAFMNSKDELDIGKLSIVSSAETTKVSTEFSFNDNIEIVMLK